MKRTLLMVSVVIGLTAAFSSLCQAQTAVMRNPYQPPPTFIINDWEPCTESMSLRIKHNLCTNVRPCGHPVDYKISLDPNFAGPTTMSGRFQNNDVLIYTPNVQHGKLRVYFQVLGKNMSSTVDYLPSCDDATFIGQMLVTIMNLHQPFIFDVSCGWSVKPIRNPNDFIIELRAMAEGNVLAQKTFPYASGDTLMTISVPMVRKANHRWPQYREVGLIATIKPKPGTTPFDYNPNDNVGQRHFELVTSNMEKSFNSNRCTGPEGFKENQTFLLGKGWVFGQSSITLHDCGSTAADEIKCDNNPLPALGQRGVRWVKRPATGEASYTLYLWCEGLANKQDNSSHLGYYFRGSVKYDMVNIRIK